MTTVKVNRAVAEYRKITKQAALIVVAEAQLQRVVSELSSDELHDYIDMTDQITEAVEEAIEDARERGHSASTARQEIARAANHAGMDKGVRA
jgi:hypothetical protein